MCESVCICLNIFASCVYNCWCLHCTQILMCTLIRGTATMNDGVGIQNGCVTTVFIWLFDVCTEWSIIYIIKYMEPASSYYRTWYTRRRVNFTPESLKPKWMFCRRISYIHQMIWNSVTVTTTAGACRLHSTAASSHKSTFHLVI